MMCRWADLTDSGAEDSNGTANVGCSGDQLSSCEWASLEDSGAEDSGFTDKPTWAALEISRKLRSCELRVSSAPARLQSSPRRRTPLQVSSAPAKLEDVTNEECDSGADEPCSMTESKYIGGHSGEGHRWLQHHNEEITAIRQQIHCQQLRQQLHWWQLYLYQNPVSPGNWSNGVPRISGTDVQPGQFVLPPGNWSNGGPRPECRGGQCVPGDGDVTVFPDISDGASTTFGLVQLGDVVDEARRAPPLLSRGAPDPLRPRHLLSRADESSVSVDLRGWQGLFDFTTRWWRPGPSASVGTVEVGDCFYDVSCTGDLWKKKSSSPVCCKSLTSVENSAAGQELFSTLMLRRLHPEDPAGTPQRGMLNRLQGQYRGEVNFVLAGTNTCADSGERPHKPLVMFLLFRESLADDRLRQAQVEAKQTLSVAVEEVLNRVAGGI